ncbi:MAG: hypothetical protein J1F69_03110 [Clostridiales bacterium]|nr:hypothetical protein [Clostridiales bacterium]
MVTTKRQIRRESDRFGGYYNAETDIPRISDYDNISDLEPITNSSIPVDEALTDNLYTAPEVAAHAAEAPAATPIEKPAPHDREDVLPTLKTRAYATEKPAEDIVQKPAKATAKRTRAALDSKTKILLCVYVVVALVLAIAVIATGVSISKASAQADMIAKSVTQKQEVIARQQQELAHLQDDDTIRGKAMEKGMVPAGEPSFSVGNVESVDYPEATPRTDGWDEFFDWMSKVVN